MIVIELLSKQEEKRDARCAAEGEREVCYLSLLGLSLDQPNPPTSSSAARERVLPLDVSAWYHRIDQK